MSDQEIETPKTADLIRKTILVIDDEKDLVAALKEFLQDEGYRVLTAYDGEEGLQRLEQVEPDLILLDVNMPRVNGLTFLKELIEINKQKNNHKLPPVVALTSRTDLQNLFQDLDLAGFIAKPFKIEELLGKINNLIEPTSDETEKGTSPQKTALSRKVFIVDNNQESSAKLAGNFLSHGYSIVAATSGTNCLERIKLEAPSTLLVNYQLSDMSGIALSEKIHALNAFKNTPVFLYGAPSDKSLNSEEKNTFITCTLKTSSPEDLFDKVQKRLKALSS